MRSTTLILSTAIISSTLLGGAAVFAMPSQAQNAHANTNANVNSGSKANTEHRYTICHATNSATNPYVMITVDYNSIVKKAGHDGHDGPVAASEAVAADMKSNKISWGDVIPAIAEHDYAGKNFTTEGILLLNNDCEMPTVTAQEDDDDTPTNGGDGSTDETDTPGSGSVDNTETDTPETTPGEETDMPVDEPGVGGVAEELPETGAASVVTVLTLIASVAVAGITYGTQHLRSLRAISFLKNL